MKRNFILAISAVLLLGSCGTYTGSGAYMGTSLGSVLGSAIGGIAGGPRGSDVGTIVGMASGAIVGAAVGNAADQKQQQAQHEVLAQRNQRIQASKKQGYGQTDECDDSFNGGTSRHYSAQGGYEIDPSQMIDTTNSGDDRIDFSASTDSSANANVPQPDEMKAESFYGEAGGNTTSSAFTHNNIEIRNVNFIDSNNDGALSADETGKIMFEIYNRGNNEIRNIEPTVTASGDERNIYISPSIMVESIAPGHGIRYTAAVKASRRIKDGNVKLMVSASRQGKPVSYITVVSVPTKRK